MTISANAELEILATEELGHACTLSWRELARITPWGDAYRGFTPSGAEVDIERAYLWSEGEEGDVLCEVVVRGLGTEAQAARLVRKPGA
ncbi:MAG TPA: hypothetical protein VG407_14505 [Caulobacteraceae bacterium]|jgi:hypothetical protein|nr:hypothetical protein [Caulobacteraceae bacterium]